MDNQKTIGKNDLLELLKIEKIDDVNSVHNSVLEGNIAKMDYDTQEQVLKYCDSAEFYKLAKIVLESLSAKASKGTILNDKERKRVISLIDGELSILAIFEKNTDITPEQRDKIICLIRNDVEIITAKHKDKNITVILKKITTILKEILSLVLELKNFLKYGIKVGRAILDLIEFIDEIISDDEDDDNKADKKSVSIKK